MDFYSYVLSITKSTPKRSLHNYFKQLYFFKIIFYSHFGGIMQKKQYLFIFVSLLYLYPSHQEAKQSIFPNLSEKRLRCFNKPKPIEIENDLEKKKSFNTDFPQLSQHTQHAHVFSLFSSVPVAPSHITDSTVWENLEIINGDHTLSHNLLSFIDRSTTSFGSDYLLYEITHPHRTANQLRQRQEAIKKIVKYESIYQLIEGSLQNIKFVEPIFFHVFEAESSFNQKMIQSFYFSSNKPVLKELKRLNGNSTAMECLTIPGRLFSYGLGMSLYLNDFTIRHCKNAFDESIKNNTSPHNWKEFASLPFGPNGRKVFTKSVSEFLRSHDPRLYALKNINSVEEIKPNAKVLSQGDLFKLASLIEKKAIQESEIYLEQADLAETSMEQKSLIEKSQLLKTCGLWGRRTTHTALVFGVAVRAYLIYQAHKRESEYNNITNYLHEKLNSVACIIRHIQLLSELIKNNPFLQDTLEHHESLHALFDQASLKTSVKLKKLCSLLLTNTFKSKPSYFSHKGRVLAAYSLLEDVKKELAPALCALGEIDALFSTVKLYKEYYYKDAYYTFPTYITADSPVITMVDMWNPFVGAKSVKNSIQLGGTEKQNIILTGPNAGGKSTFLKGTTLSILLAQTLGIAPAKELTFTPFAKINTYMNITDDTAGGNSLFKSEVLRAQNLITTVDNLDKHQFSLSIMDEMFSGTSPKEGAAASYAVAKNLGSKNNSILLLATHFPLLTQLEKSTSDFTNYQVRVLHNNDGTFSYPFMLEKGIADQNVALNIIQQQGFSSSILEEAQSILHSEFNK